MKKLITILMAMLGLNTACSQSNYDNKDVNDFADLIKQDGVQLLDVRTAQEYADGHIDGAANIDVKSGDFLTVAIAQLSPKRPVAVYCRSGRRSANAAALLADKGFKVTNLSGGIVAWQSKSMPTTTVEADVFTTKSGKSVTFFALMHASIRIVFDGKEIEIDPVSQLGPRTVDYTALPKADYIFVTHEHRDHFDGQALTLLSSNHSQLVTNRRCADELGHGQVMANGDHLQLSDNITVEAIPAYNTTEGRTQFHPRGRDNGYILTLDGLRIYIAGDTEDIPEMTDLRDIDIAFLPCNQPYTMTPDQLIRAARMVKPRVLFPYHYGDTDVTTLPAQLRADGIDVRIRHYE